MLGFASLRRLSTCCLQRRNYRECRRLGGSNDRGVCAVSRTDRRGKSGPALVPLTSVTCGSNVAGMNPGAVPNFSNDYWLRNRPTFSTTPARSLAWQLTRSFLSEESAYIRSLLAVFANRKRYQPAAEDSQPGAEIARFCPAVSKIIRAKNLLEKWRRPIRR